MTLYNLRLLSYFNQRVSADGIMSSGNWISVDILMWEIGKWRAGKCIRVVYEIGIRGNVIHGYVKMSEWKVFALELFIAHSHTCIHCPHSSQCFNRLHQISTLWSHIQVVLPSSYGSHCCVRACSPANNNSTSKLSTT